MSSCQQKEFQTPWRIQFKVIVSPELEENLLLLLFIDVAIKTKPLPLKESDYLRKAGKIKSTVDRPLVKLQSQSEVIKVIL